MNMYLVIQTYIKIDAASDYRRCFYFFQMTVTIKLNDKIFFKNCLIKVNEYLFVYS